MFGNLDGLMVIWGSLVLALGIVATIALTETRTPEGRVRRNTRLRHLKRESSDARAALARAKADASPTAVAWNDAMLNAQGHYYLSLAEAEWELFFARNPASGRCLFTTDRLRVFEMGLEVDNQPWPFIALGSAPRFTGSGSQTLRRLELTDRQNFKTQYQLDAAGGREGMADVYDQGKISLHNAWNAFVLGESDRQHRLSVAIQRHADRVRTSHELDGIARNFKEVMDADPGLRRLWQAQCRIMELDQAVAKLDFAARHGSNWLEQVS